MNESVFCTEPHYGASPCRPDLHGILIPGRRGRLLSVLYTAAGEGLHPTVLLLHGIPGWERNLDLAQALRRVGFCVATFHYSGSWGADGEFGEATLIALRSFQRSRGLEPDGICGQLSWNALLGVT